jgi:hypothetical protein
VGARHTQLPADCRRASALVCGCGSLSGIEHLLQIPVLERGHEEVSTVDPKKTHSQQSIKRRRAGCMLAGYWIPPDSAMDNPNGSKE